MLDVVLYRPENPHNTGAVVRTCAVLGVRLHLIGPYGFGAPSRSATRDIARAAMSYLDVVDLIEHASWDEYRAHVGQVRRFAFWDEGETRYDEVPYAPGDHLLFGRESDGLPADVLSTHPTLRIPMPGTARGPRPDHRAHSLNLSVSVGIAVAHARHVVERPVAPTAIAATAPAVSRTS